MVWGSRCNRGGTKPFLARAAIHPNSLQAHLFCWDNVMKKALGNVQDFQLWPRYFLQSILKIYLRGFVSTHVLGGNHAMKRHTQSSLGFCKMFPTPVWPQYLQKTLELLHH